MSPTQRRKRRSISGSREGFTLTELLMAVGLTGIVALTCGVLILNLYQSNRRRDLQIQMSYLRDVFVKTLTSSVIDKATGADQSGWRNTVANSRNPAMTCLRPGNTCNNGASGTFTPIMPGSGAAESPYLYKAGPPMELGYQPYNATDGPRRGFTPDGRVCNSYSEVVGSEDPRCPIRIDFQFSVACNPTPCANPEVTVQITFRLSLPRAQRLALGSFSMNRYSTTFVRSGDLAKKVAFECNTAGKAISGVLRTGAANCVNGSDLR